MTSSSNSLLCVGAQPAVCGVQEPGGAAQGLVQGAVGHGGQGHRRTPQEAGQAVQGARLHRPPRQVRRDTRE